MLKWTSAVVASVLLCGASPAFAGPWGNVDCSQAPAPVCDLGVGNNERPHEAWDTGRPSSTDQSSSDAEDPYVGCSYKPVDYQAPDGQPQEPGGWFMVLCSPDGKDPLSHGPVWVPSGGVRPTLSPEQVAEMARNRLLLPSVTISASPADEQLVSLPTWLWLSGGWEEVSASASVRGVSVTAVAKPMSVTWSMGDGGSVTCAGPGTPFAPGHRDPRSASPDCGYTYRTSSAGQGTDAYKVTVTVTWAVTWAGAGQGGTFPNLTTSASSAFRVAESQGIATG
ncbi:hypothetical protein F4560_001058 [Saccharothrix ecbatanensis]|uniref:ATP/GTP-binding protein n=1 Tax=Saccharothrix ecbatanensis TaxID=1105145 RepID=A0A7W9HFI0_9PSEU|nr:hypothetical protein [Saccharothrix ecbatanensis]MBB5801290.1 hypothetical protein [Saccharothrix ecbatanensis]